MAVSKEKDQTKETVKKDKKVAETGEKEPQKRSDNGNRDSKGRFGKGNNANPGGRPKIPDEFKEYGRQAPARLRAIADDPETPAKVKAEIEKWFAEMTYGKPTQQQIVEANVENNGNMTITFEGELAEWSE